MPKSPREGWSGKKEGGRVPIGCTGYQLKARYPERYKVIVRMISLGIGDKEIGKQTRSDPDTIKQIRLRQVRDIEAQREEMRSRSYVNAVLCTEKATEMVDGARNLTEASVAGGIWTDKWMALSGMSTASISVEHRIDFEGLFEKLKKEAEETMRKMKPVRAEVVEPRLLGGGDGAGEGANAS